MTTVRVVVVDDQTLVRQGIVGLLELIEGVEVVGQAADGLEALRVIDQSDPHVVLLDIRMPKLDGIGVLKALREGRSRSHVLVLTTFDDGALARSCIQAGACGYMMKDVSLEALADAIRAVASGSTAFATRLTRDLWKPAGEVDGAEFTPRERDVLRLLGEGLSNREIARSLGLAEGTVKNHVSNVLLKLQVPDRTRAALKLRSIDRVSAA